jgi:hypothetical protein
MMLLDMIDLYLRMCVRYMCFGKCVCFRSELYRVFWKVCVLQIRAVHSALQSVCASDLRCTQCFGKCVCFISQLYTVLRKVCVLHI